jgi:hypothetical protein
MFHEFREFQGIAVFVAVADSQRVSQARSTVAGKLATLQFQFSCVLMRGDLRGRAVRKGVPVGQNCRAM